MTGSVIGDYLAEADDLFECLRQIRRVVEPIGWRLLCGGAQINAWPDTISRAWSGGLYLHLLEPGVHASDEQAIGIFDEINCNQVSTVQEQAEYYRNYLRSFAGPPLFPPPAAVALAKQCAGGLVIQIEGSYNETESVPPQAVMGCWEVGADGVIASSFIPNPNFVSKRNQSDRDSGIGIFFKGRSRS